MCDNTILEPSFELDGGEGGKKNKANTFELENGVMWGCELVLSVSLLGTLLHSVSAVVSWPKHAQMKCHAFLWRCHSEDWLYSLRCLFALDSWLLSHWLTVRDYLCASKRHKYIAAPLCLSLHGFEAVHKSIAMKLNLWICECCRLQFHNLILSPDQYCPFIKSLFGSSTYSCSLGAYKAGGNG